MKTSAQIRAAKALKADRLLGEMLEGLSPDSELSKAIVEARRKTLTVRNIADAI